jgi:hypothetical protein
VLHTVRPYLVFWDPPRPPPDAPIPDNSRRLIERYLSDVSADRAVAADTFAVTRQYYDSSGYAGAAQTFNAAQQVINDVNRFPAQDYSTCSSSDVSSSYPSCLSDSQIQDELAGLIRDQGLPSGIGPGAPIYFVLTPPDVNVCVSGIGCASNTLCGYHGYFSAGSGYVIYAVVPFLLVSSKPKDCQTDGLKAVQEPNGDLADIIVDNLSHESNEAITDPLGSAWYQDPSGDALSGNEVADNCQNAYKPTIGGQPAPAGGLSYGTLYDQLIAGDQYYTQTVWSNGDGGCVPTPATGLPSGSGPTASFTASPPALAGTVVTFDPSASMTVDGLSSVTWNFGDGASEFTIGSPLTASLPTVTHTYKQAGVYQAVLTLVDARGNLSTAVRPITVYGTPLARFRVTPAHAVIGTPVTFDARASSDPNPGARISSYTWSFANGARSAGARVRHTFKSRGAQRVTLTVTDTLGLSATVSRLVLTRPPGRIISISLTGGAVGHRHGSGGRVAHVIVAVSQAGQIKVGSRSVSLTRGGRTDFPLTLSPAQRRALRAHRPITLYVSVVYVPQAGGRLTARRTFRIGP